MDAATAAKLLAILLTPTAVAGAVVWLPRLVRALAPRPRRAPAPAGPPLERTAAALRRLLAEHAHVIRTRGLAVRAGHLVALEGAITDCALDAARAVGVPPPARSGRAPLPRDELRRLLGELADAGLVLPDHERFGR